MARRAGEVNFFNWYVTRGLNLFNCELLVDFGGSIIRKWYYLTHLTITKWTLPYCTDYGLNSIPVAVKLRLPLALLTKILSPESKPIPVTANIPLPIKGVSKAIYLAVVKL